MSYLCHEAFLVGSFPETAALGLRPNMEDKSDLLQQQRGEQSTSGTGETRATAFARLDASTKHATPFSFDAGFHLMLLMIRFPIFSVTFAPKSLGLPHSATKIRA